MHHLRSTCKNCGHTVITDPFKVGEVLCTKCGTFNKNVVTFCNKCGDPVALQLKYDVTECQERGMTFAAPLKVTIRLTLYDKDADTGHKSIRDIKEQEVYFGEIPLMTENGTFIVNGTERVIVSQLHRSPGVFFEANSQKTYFLGKIIPYRGSWVEFEYDTKNLLYVRIDRKRKFLATIFLRALGLKNDAEIVKAFYQIEKISLKDRKLFWEVSEGLIGNRISKSIDHPAHARSGGAGRTKDYGRGLQGNPKGQDHPGGSGFPRSGRRFHRQRYRRSLHGRGAAGSQYRNYPHRSEHDSGFPNSGIAGVLPGARRHRLRDGARP